MAVSPTRNIEGYGSYGFDQADLELFTPVPDWAIEHGFAMQDILAGQSWVDACKGMDIIRIRQRSKQISSSEKVVYQQVETNGRQEFVIRLSSETKGEDMQEQVIYELRWDVFDPEVQSVKLKSYTTINGQKLLPQFVPQSAFSDADMEILMTLTNMARQQTYDQA